MGSFVSLVQRKIKELESVLLSFAQRVRELFLGPLGCKHYKRNCKIRAPCCDQIFPCPLCHDEAFASPNYDSHKLDQKSIEKVICSRCKTEQDVAQICNHCGIVMGKYFCSKCNFHDDETRKGIYHCDGCGRCRGGGRDNSFHCNYCGTCLPMRFLSNHLCIIDCLKDKYPVYLCMLKV